MPSTKPRPLSMRHDCLIGIPAIDEQHALLIKLANRLLDNPDARSSDEVIVETLSDLGRFCVLHFQTEEKLMVELGLPVEEIAAHYRAHSEILEQYAELNLSAIHDKSRTAGEIFAQVKQWVGDHLHEEDLKLWGKLSRAD